MNTIIIIGLVSVCITFGLIAVWMYNNPHHYTHKATESEWLSSIGKKSISNWSKLIIIGLIANIVILRVNIHYINKSINLLNTKINKLDTNSATIDSIYFEWFKILDKKGSIQIPIDTSAPPVQNNIPSTHPKFIHYAKESTYFKSRGIYAWRWRI